MAPPRTGLLWSGWGDPAQARALPEEIRVLLRDGLGAQREIGELGVAALAALKRELDPTGVLNPGILIASS